MAKKYCDGIDCQWCSEKEPCIYKIANRQAEIIEQTTKQYEALQKQYITVLNLIKKRTKNESLETKTI